MTNAYQVYTGARQLLEGYAAAMQPLCRREGLAPNGVDILLFLANNPERNRAADIVRGRGMSKGHVSLSLRSLEDRGLVACQADGTDRWCRRPTCCGSPPRGTGANAAWYAPGGRSLWCSGGGRCRKRFSAG